MADPLLLRSEPFDEVLGVDGLVGILGAVLCWGHQLDLSGRVGGGGMGCFSRVIVWVAFAVVPLFEVHLADSLVDVLQQSPID